MNTNTKELNSSIVVRLNEQDRSNLVADAESLGVSLSTLIRIRLFASHVLSPRERLERAIRAYRQNGDTDQAQRGARRTKRTKPRR